MYVPAAFREERIEVLHATMREIGAAAIVADGPDGLIASHLKLGEDAIAAYVRDLVASGELRAPQGPDDGLTPQVSVRHALQKLGERLPEFWLADLTGARVALTDLLGGPLVLLFWHPRCTICLTLVDDLKRWEAEPPSGAPTLVFVAGGEEEDIRELNQGFRSRTLVDTGFDLGPRLGTWRTPAAIAVDGDGRVTSSMAIGARDVRALLGLAPPVAEEAAQS